MTYVPQVIEPELRGWLDACDWHQRIEARTQARLRVGDRSLAEVIERLCRVYDGPAMRRMSEGVERSLVVSLHALGARMVVGGQLLALGLDLVDTPLAGAEHKLHSDLQRVQHWWGARFEIGARAGLARRGAEVRRPRLEKDQVQYDFDVSLDGVPVALECKAISVGDHNLNARVVREAFEGLVAVAGRAGALLDGRFTASRPFREQLEARTDAFMSEVAPRYFEALRCAVRDAPRDGAPFAVGAFGTLELAMRDNDGLGPYGLDVVGVDASDRLWHLASHLRKAGAQLRAAPAGAHRVAAVWLGGCDEGAPALAARLRAVIGATAEVDGRVVDLRRAVLGLDTIVLLAGTREWASLDTGLIAASVLPVGTDAPALPAWVLDGLCAWREVVTIDASTEKGR